jgi:hypothetical protein
MVFISSADIGHTFLCLIGTHISICVLTGSPGSIKIQYICLITSVFVKVYENFIIKFLIVLIEWNSLIPIFFYET